MATRNFTPPALLLINRCERRSAPTTAQANRFYDDKSTFTGQYKQGGPDLNQNKDFLATFREGVDSTKLKMT